MTMREQMARALIGLGTGHDYERERCVDAVLNALMEPSDAVLRDARWLKRTDQEDAARGFVAAEDDVLEIFTDIILAIKEGK